MLLGAVGVPEKLATKPNEVLPFAATLLFQSALRTVASDPDCDSTPFQALAMVSPSGRTQLTVQPNMVDVPGLVTVIWPWKPPGQLLVTVYAAAHVVLGGGGALAPVPVTSPLPPSKI